MGQFYVLSLLWNTFIRTHAVVNKRAFPGRSVLGLVNSGDWCGLWASWATISWALPSNICYFKVIFPSIRFVFISKMNHSLYALNRHHVINEYFEKVELFQHVKQIYTRYCLLQKVWYFLSKICHIIVIYKFWIGNIKSFVEDSMITLLTVWNVWMLFI